jgi:hypothetical protein
VLARLQLSQDAGVGGAAAVAIPGQGCARVGRPVRVSTVSLGPSVIMMRVAALATSKTMRRCVTGPSLGTRTCFALR